MRHSSPVLQAVTALVASCLCAAFFAGCRAGCVSTSSSSSSASGPDVYLIIIDSLRADHLGLGGYVSATSPELDAWARDAVVFDRAYTTAPWTLPSIAAVMTGHHPYAVGVREKQTAVPDSVTTLGELFKSSGYDTAAVVAHIYLLPKYGLMQGMDSVNTDMVKGHHKIISSDGVTDRALRVVRKHAARDADTPLFLLTHYFDPHYNYILHPEIYDSYPDYKGPIKSGMAVKDLRKSLAKQKGQELADSRRQITNLYDSEIRYTDHQVARLLAGIKAAGRDDNALIIIMGDHGEELGQRATRWVGHTKVVSEGVLRVPLMIRLPHNWQPRQRVAEPVSLVDLMPTIAAQAGLALPKDLPIWGRALNLSSDDGHRPVLFSETGRWARMQAVIRDRWKLVEYPKKPPGRRVLYDLRQDPGETHDVSAQQPEILAELRADLATWNTALEADHQLMSADESTPELSAEEVEALRAMGYME